MRVSFSRALPAPPDSERVRNPTDSTEPGALGLARCVLLEAWRALTQQIRVITKHFCTIGSTGQMGASGISGGLEIISLALAAVTSKTRNQDKIPVFCYKPRGLALTFALDVC